jgi:phosphatidylethanolamine-binding protein (PEBP) family uncharacterized protein
MEYVERSLSWLLANRKGYQEKRLILRAPFSSLPTPSINITSQSCGASPAKLGVDYTQDGKDLIPSLSWSLTPSSTFTTEDVKEWLLVIEDVDSPLSKTEPTMHSAYYAIPASKTSFSHVDLELKTQLESGKKDETGKLKGGILYARNHRGKLWLGPRPLRGHGEHNYFFMIVALGKELGLEGLATRDEILKGLESEGTVLGWGEWVGVAIRE